MKWFSKFQPPKSTVTDDDIQILNDKAKEISQAVDRMERAVMDGESMWMLVKCPPGQVPMYMPEKPPELEILTPCMQT
ncbi:MAG: hypothetical protein ABIL06_13380 [Pseudomonadota bacterium]